MPENTFIACDKVGDAWFNNDLARFAIIPDTDESLSTTAEIVEEILQTFTQHDDGDTKDEVLAELLDLHARGLILWPLGFQWGRTALGNIFGQRFARVVEQDDPTSLEVRDQIFKSDQFKAAVWREMEKRNRSFSFWQYFMTLRLCTTNIRKLDDVQEIHLVQIITALKPNNLWRACPTMASLR
jgi:hypothetical protein